MSSPIVQSKGDYLRELDVPAFLERPDVQAFVGGNFAHYKRVWLGDYAKKGRADKMMCLHWNFGAVFGWFGWFAYRKMWRVLFALAGFFFIMGFVEAYYTQVTGREISSTIYGLGLFALGFYSKSLYFRHVAGFFHRYGYLPKLQRDALIHEMGGTTVMWSFMAIIIFPIIMGLVSTGANIVFPSAEVSADVSVIEHIRAMRGNR